MYYLHVIIHFSGKTARCNHWDFYIRNKVKSIYSHGAKIYRIAKIQNYLECISKLLSFCPVVPGSGRASETILTKRKCGCNSIVLDSAHSVTDGP